MPYREKFAWLSLISIAVTFGPYFTLVALSEGERGLPDLRQLSLFAAAAVLQMILVGVGTLLIRRRSPDEAAVPADERDRAIDLRSIRIAYFVLIGGVIVVGCVLPFVSQGWAIINAAIFTIIVAEIAHYSVVVFSYRRQA